MLKELVWQFSIKSKIKLLYRKIVNNVFLISFFTVLFLLTINHLIILIVLVFYSYYLFKKDKVLLLLSIIISSIIFAIFNFYEKKYVFENKNTAHGVIIDITKKETYNLLIIKENGKKTYVYDNSFTKLDIGNTIYVEGENIEITKERIENLFNYKDYLKHEKVVSVIRSDKIKIINSEKSIGIIKTYFSNYLDIFENEEKVYLKALILGDDALFDDDMKDAIKKNGISHLFAVSGLHIGLLVSIITSLLKKIKMKDNMIDIIISFILLIYLIITSFSPSISRSSLMYFLYVINKRLKLDFSSMDIISISFLFQIIINPYNMFKVGFILSYQVATLIILTSPLIKEKNQYIQMFIISFLSFIISMPIIVNLNFEINILSFFVNVLFISLTSIIILPLTFFTLIFYPFSYIYKYIVLFFSKVTLFISNIFSLSLAIPKFSFFHMFIYYFLIFLIITFFLNRRIRKILISLLIIFLLIIINKVYFLKGIEIYFLDVYNGDCTIICNYDKDEYIMIDTGTNDNDDVTNFLKSKGIRRLDYLILTHNHDDHNGAALDVINNIKVLNIITSIYDTSIYSNYDNVIKVKKDNKVYLKGTTITVLGPTSKDSDENDNSLILHFFLGDKYFLFMGDASKDVEMKLPNVQVDILKVAHHGSTTSTSLSFLEGIKPEIAIIMATRVKMFKFPRKETIDSLNKLNVKIYRTDLDYSICYKYKNGISKVECLNDN